MAFNSLQAITVRRQLLVRSTCDEQDAGFCEAPHILRRSACWNHTDRRRNVPSNIETYLQDGTLPTATALDALRTFD